MKTEPSSALRQEYAKYLSQKQEPLKAQTINSYLRSIKSFPNSLDVADSLRQSAFNKLSSYGFKETRQVLESADNYLMLNKKTHGAFPAAANYYLQFLTERESRGYIALKNESESERRFRDWLGKQVYGLSQSTIKNYTKALDELPSSLTTDKPIPRSMYCVDKYQDFKDVEKTIRNAANFEEINKASKGFLQGTLSASLRQYGEFLQYWHDFEILQSDSGDSKDTYEQINNTEVKRNVIARSGQSSFRRRLLKKNSSCELCGLHYSQLLIASHIKPWRNSSDFERLDISNGLVLCVNHDSLFDKGLVSFSYDSGGLIAISKEIARDDYQKLNLNSNMYIQLMGRRASYMEYHFTTYLHIHNLWSEQTI
ncbi:MAG: HNH endonuclease [Coriobacteriia bacterium]|nr:HNH endonuclease [Coriobacteriia bacterium]